MRKLKSHYRPLIVSTPLSHAVEPNYLINKTRYQKECEEVKRSEERKDESGL